MIHHKVNILRLIQYRDRSRGSKRARERQFELSSAFTAQLSPSTHQAAAPPLETSATAPCRGHGLVCAALHFEDPGADHPEINALSQRHSLSLRFARAPPHCPGRSRLLVHGGAGFACKGTCKKEAVYRSSAQLRTRLYAALVVYHRLMPLSTATVQCLQLPCSRNPLCFTAIGAQGMPRHALAVIVVSCTASCSNNKPAPQKKRACSPRTRLYGTGTGPAHGQRRAW